MIDQNWSLTHVSCIGNSVQFLFHTGGEHRLPGSAITSARLVANPALWAFSNNHCISTWGFRPNDSIFFNFYAKFFTLLKKNIGNYWRMHKKTMQMDAKKVFWQSKKAILDYKLDLNQRSVNAVKTSNSFIQESGTIDYWDIHSCWFLLVYSVLKSDINILWIRCFCALDRGLKGIDQGIIQSCNKRWKNVSDLNFCMWILHVFLHYIVYFKAAFSCCN